MMEDVGEVLIVGAGPVGVFSALALAQTGVKVTLIEAGAQIMDSPRNAVVMPSTILVFQELGILPEIEALAVPCTTLGLHVPGFRESFTLHYPEMFGWPIDRQLHVGQHLFTGIGLEHARRAGVDVRFGTALTGFSQTDDHVVAEVETANGREQLRAKWLIGADGGRSAVRNAMNVTFDGFTWSNRFVATNIYCDFASYGYGPANFICDPVYGGVIALLSKDGLWRVTYQEDAALPAETFLERLPERFDHILPKAAAYTIDTASPYALNQRAASSLREGRVLLAGDAAHVTNPNGGMGLTGGIWDAMILSDVLGAVARGEESEVILDAYSRERLRIFWEIASASAVENKKMQERSDPAERQADLEGFRALATDPELSKATFAYPFRLIGDTLRETSRWRTIDPTGGAIIGSSHSQLSTGQR
ncbi:FAD-dependent oxidoreductase [Sphingobium nicotianae]|uniref:FAD-dependent monooxygenase n=1 Tax=Sphingobium nicotianae TaxID=2782607 RepID=A0A9X1DA18_9SPHN|nr:NAD(P)/FAD-dependent oxidoreductase [Sphingobium nicotianae]MBT2186145.1 FAD-dependent monooxygenase [Sphingobium nicotianae]